MSKTKIEWATHTWNPVVGCSKVSEGCRNCYAERIHSARHKGWREGWENAPKQYHRPFEEVQFYWHRLHEPHTWRKARRVFCCSMSDLFHSSLLDSDIITLLNTMEDVNANRIHGGKEPHTFIVLTKRAERMREVVNSWLRGFELNRLPQIQNIWFGVSVENQEAADERIPHLLDISAPAPIVRFISAEPLLGPVDLGLTGTAPGGRYEPVGNRLSWIIVGGETGVDARQMRPEWARNLRDQAVEAGIPFFFKQWGEYDEEGRRVGRRKAGRLLDGREWNEFPEVE